MSRKPHAPLRFWPMPTQRLHDPLRRAAIRAVLLALRTGKLTKQPCEVCGRKRAEGHHDDYALPLQIRWLCRSHHRERDAELKRIRCVAPPPIPLDKEACMARNKLLTNGSRRKHLRPSAKAIVERATLAMIDEVIRTGLSFSEIARRTGSSRQWVSEVYAGGIKSLSTLAVFAEAVGCDVHIELRPQQRAPNSEVA